MAAFYSSSMPMGDTREQRAAAAMGPPPSASFGRQRQEGGAGYVYTPQVQESLDFIRRYARGESPGRALRSTNDHQGAYPSNPQPPAAKSSAIDTVLVSPVGGPTGLGAPDRQHSYHLTATGGSTLGGSTFDQQRPQQAPYASVVRAPSVDNDAAGHRLGPGGRSPPRHSDPSDDHQAQLRRIIDGGARQTSIWSRKQEVVSPPPPPLIQQQHYNADNDYNAATVAPRSIWASASEQRDREAVTRHPVANGGGGDGAVDRSAPQTIRLAQSVRHYPSSSFEPSPASTFHNTDGHHAGGAVLASGAGVGGSAAPPIAAASYGDASWLLSKENRGGGLAQGTLTGAAAARGVEKPVSWEATEPRGGMVASRGLDSGHAWGAPPAAAMTYQQSVPTTATQQPQRRPLFNVPTTTPTEVATQRPKPWPPVPGATAAATQPAAAINTSAYTRGFNDSSFGRPAVETPVTAQPRTASDLVRALNAVELDVALVAIIQFLKAKYANSTDEDSLPLSTMEPDDVLALSQCFHAEMSRVVDQQRIDGNLSGAISPPAAAVDFPPAPQQPNVRHGNQPKSKFQGLADSDDESPGRPLNALRPHEASTTATPAPPPPPPYPPQQLTVPPPPAASADMVSQQRQRSQAPIVVAPGQQPPPAAAQPKPSGLPPMPPAQQQQPPAPPAAATSADDSAAFAPRVARSRANSPANSRSGSVVDANPPPRSGATQRSVSPSVVSGTFATYMPKMKEGCDLVKYGRNGAPQLRFFRIVVKEVAVSATEKARMAFLAWGKNAKSTPSGELPLIELLDVTQGATTAYFKRNSQHGVVGVRGEVVPSQQCFTLTFTERTVDLYAPGLEEFDTWFRGMKLVVQRNRELEAEGAAADGAEQPKAASTTAAKPTAAREL